MVQRRGRDMSPKDIAEMDKREYKEPGRDLMATKPATPGDVGGSRGDVDNERAQIEGVPGSMGRTENVRGSDENNVLAKGKNS